MQIQVAQGSADFRIVHMYDDENYEIDTANQAFTILRPGEYRVDVSPDGSQTVITVRSGAGEETAIRRGPRPGRIWCPRDSGETEPGVDSEPINAARNRRGLTT